MSANTSALIKSLKHWMFVKYLRVLCVYFAPFAVPTFLDAERAESAKNFRCDRSINPKKV